ncbi:MAG: hypothetical protein ACRDY1_01265, partial [Acidimicrobiales bacterium]
VPAGPGRPRSPWPRAAVVVAAVAAVVAVLVFVGPRSSAPPSTSTHVAKGRHVHKIGTADTPPGWIALPDLLPGTGADIEGASVVTGPVPVPSTGTYEQAYQGPQPTDPAELLVTTVQAQPGAISGYQSGSQRVSVGGGWGYLTSYPDRQLLWQTSDDVVVSLESTAMSAPDMVTAAQMIEPHPAAQLGVTVTGTLPDGLAFVAGGFAGDDSSLWQVNSVMFSEGTCHAYTQEWAGTAADFTPVAIIAQSTRVVNVNGTPGLLAQIESDTSALLWEIEPGVDMRLQGSDCDLTTLASDLRTVDQSQLQAVVASLGSRGRDVTPRAPTPSSPAPPGSMFGLAH